MMPINSLNGGMTLIPTGPSFLATMAVDEGEGEVALKASMLSTWVTGVSRKEGIGGSMMESYGMGILEEDKMIDIRVMGRMDARKGVIGENTLPSDETR